MFQGQKRPMISGFGICAAATLLCLGCGGSEVVPPQNQVGTSEPNAVETTRSVEPAQTQEQPQPPQPATPSTPNGAENNMPQPTDQSPVKPSMPQPPASNPPMPEPPIPETPPARSYDLAGVWDGREIGEVVISGGPHEFTGTYSATNNRALGLLAFKAEGDALLGTWRDTDDRDGGTLKVTVSSDGRYVYATFTPKDGGTAIQTSWIRPRTIEPITLPEPPATVLAAQGWCDLPGKQGQARALHFSPNSKRLISIQSQTGASEIHLWDLVDGTLRILTQGYLDPPVAALQDDGKSVVHSETRSGAGGKSIYRTVVRDLESGRITSEVAGKLTMASPHGTAILDNNNELAVWDLKSGKHVPIQEKSSGAEILISPDGKTVAVYGDSDVRLFDVADGRERDGVVGLQGRIEKHGAAFSADGSRLVCVTNQGINTLWDISDPAARPRLLASVQARFGQNGMAFSPDGAVIAGYQDTNKLALLDARTLKPRAEVTASTPVNFTRKGLLIAPTPRNAQVVVADASGRTLTTLPAGKGKLDFYRAAFSPDGSLLAVPLQNGDIRLFQLAPTTDQPAAEPRKLAELPHPALGYDNPLLQQFCHRNYLQFSPEGKYLIGGQRLQGSLASAYAVWEISTGKGLASGQTCGIAVLPDGRTLYTEEFAPPKTWYARKLNLTTGRAQQEKLEVNADSQLPFITLALSTDGKTMVGIRTKPGSGPDELVVMPEPDPRRAEVLADADTAAEQFTFSPDGTLFAFNDKGRIRLFDLVKKVERPTTAEQGNSFLGFTDGGRALGTIYLSGTGKDHMRIYDLDSSQLVHTIDATPGHAASVTAAAISPVGKTYVTCDKDGTVLLKNWETGKELSRFKAHDEAIVVAAFSPDGKLLVTGTNSNKNGFMRIWSLGD